MTIPRVILDTDSGYDDAWALFLLLKAHSQNIIQLVAIICGSGNTHVDYCLINTCRVLEVAQQNIPVFRGAPEPILSIGNRIHDHFSGIDGFGDIFEATHLPDMSPVNFNEHGVSAIARIVRENPDEISIITIGALTNVALAIRMYPEEMKLVRNLTTMGGNFLGIGNITPSAEFNAYFDPEAVDIVLRELKCPITIVPWELFIPPRNKLTWEWRKDVLGAVDHPILTLLNPVENSIFKSFAPSKEWACADCMAIAAFLAPNEIINISESAYIAIELQGTLTRGQFVVDRGTKVPNANIVTEFYETNFVNTLFWVVCADNDVQLDEFFVLEALDDYNVN